MEDGSPGFESKDEQELYLRLMGERQRIQKSLEDKKRRSRVGTLQSSSQQQRPSSRGSRTTQSKLEERERGFQLYLSGANEERVEEFRKRERLQAQQGPEGLESQLGDRSARRNWQMETVEIKGKDGVTFRTSPVHGEPPTGTQAAPHEPTDDEGIREEIGNSADDISRPSTAASTASATCGPGVDRDTHGVLKMMTTASKNQLLQMRESLARNVEPRPQRLSISRSGSKLESGQAARPPSAGADASGARPPCSASIANAIQAENARVKAQMAGLPPPAPEVVDTSSASAATSGNATDPIGVRPGSGQSSRPPTRPSSKAGRRLPLSAEAAMEGAPPSVLAGSPSSRQNSATRLGSSSGSQAQPDSLNQAAVRASSPLRSTVPPPVPDLGTSSSSSKPPPAPASQSQSSFAAASGAGGILNRGATATEQLPDELLDRLGRLDSRKQRALLRVLDSLESDGGGGGGGQSPGDSPQLRPKSGATAREPSEPSFQQSLAPPAASAVARDPAAIRIRVLSNWGDAKYCGLSLLEVLSPAGESIKVPPASLFLQGTLGGSTTLARVLEGRGSKTNEKQMWSGAAQLHDDGRGLIPFEIGISFPQQQSERALAALRLWNFNSSDSLGKGLRDVEVWRGEELLWSGTLARGTGTEAVSPTVIPLDRSFSAMANMHALQLQPQPAAPAAQHRGYPSAADLPRAPEKPVWLSGPSPPARDQSPGSILQQQDGSPPSASSRSARGRRSFSESSPQAAQLPLAEAVSGEGSIFNGAGGSAKCGIEPVLEQRPLEYIPSAMTSTDQDLMQSLRALDHFRTSQSRRFFGGLPEALAAARGDDAGQGHDKPTPSLSSAAKPGSVEVAEDKDEIDLSFAEQVVHHASMNGLHIPIVEFNQADHDMLDGLLGPDERPDVMGSSLLGTQLDMMQSVVIPTLPSGRTLVLNCVSTWGDQSFLGLAGIEIFDGHGCPVVLKDVQRQVKADPPSINVLPEYDNDPRTVDKLFDQVNLTKDDLHVWLAPLFPGKAHTITIDLERRMQIAMIRVWNYNKSRLHSTRGVRDMEILLDGAPIFVGEIRRAPGLLTDLDQACEHILFTQDESVLLNIEKHDWLPEHLPVEDEDLDGLGAADISGLDVLGPLRQRPPTADVHAAGGAVGNGLGVDGRPITRASSVRQGVTGVACSSITLVIHSTWGDGYYVGLTALEVLGPSLAPIPLRADQISASPRDLNDLEGVDGDPRVLDNLLNGVCCTVEDSNMWLSPFLSQQQPQTQKNTITIDLPGSVEVAGFHIWNYNKNVEDTSRGVKEFAVFCDDRYVATFLARKAPGHINFDFKQVILLSQPPAADNALQSHRGQPGLPPGMPGVVAPRLPSRERRAEASHRRQPSRERSALGLPGETAPDKQERVQQQYETPLHPCGFLFKIVLLNTWSDLHYIGLDGIELLDIDGRPLRPRRAHSSCGSVRDLPGMENDIRTEENLLYGDPGSSGRMWLAPYTRQSPNTLELVFDEPTRISCIRFWNYSRTPSRGARDIEIYVDDLLVYQGVLRQRSDPQEQVAAPQKEQEAILFTTSPSVVAREQHAVYLPGADDLVRFYDVAAAMDDVGDFVAQRPMTALLKRPQ